MNFPKNLKYTKTHEWVRFEDETTAYVGITDYAQDQLGDLVFVNLPAEGDTLACGEAFADVETVAEVNEALADAPEMMNEAPYEAWFVRVEDITDTDDLMDAEEYEEFVKTEG